MVSLKGTATVLDDAGVEHAAEDGTFGLVLWEKGGTGHQIEVKVEKGNWATQVPPDVKLEVTDLRLGGRPAYVEVEVDKVPIPEDGFLAIRARWLKATILRVLGEDTKADLIEIEVVSGIDWPLEECIHPGSYGEKNVVLQDVSSPVELPIDDSRFSSEQGTFWVRAPGYAWGRIEIDHRSVGERSLTLKRAADLEVTLKNFRAGSKAVLRVREAVVVPAEAIKAARDEILRVQGLSAGEPQIDVPESVREIKKAILSLLDRGQGSSAVQAALQNLETLTQPKVEMGPSEEGTTRIPGLAPGRYEVTVEIGPWWKIPEELGRAEVQLEVGQTAQVVLSLKDPPSRPDPVPFEGTLFIPPAWGRLSFSLELKPMDLPEAEDFEDRIQITQSSMRQVEGEPGLYRWSAGQVIPGRYEVEIYGLTFKQVIVVGPTGQTSAQIELGEPAEVSVRFVDAETGEPAEVHEILWFCKYAEGITGGSPNSVERDAESGEFVFRAPAGEIILAVWDGEYQGEEREERGFVTVPPGKSRHTLRVHRTCGIRVVLKDGAAAVPWDWRRYKLHLKRLDGPGEESGSGGDSSAHRVNVTQPGLYEITLAPIDGFEPVAPQQVIVKPREFTDVEVKLER